MRTHHFSLNNTFIKIMIFRIFKYTYLNRIQIPDIFGTSIKKCPMAIQTSIFQMIICFFTANYLADDVLVNVDVSKSKF